MSADWRFLQTFGKLMLSSSCHDWNSNIVDPLVPIGRQTCSSHANCQARRFTLAMKIVFENFPTRYEFFRFRIRGTSWNRENGIRVFWCVSLSWSQNIDPFFGGSENERVECKQHLPSLSVHRWLPLFPVFFFCFPVFPECTSHMTHFSAILCWLFISVFSS